MRCGRLIGAYTQARELPLLTCIIAIMQKEELSVLVITGKQHRAQKRMGAKTRTRSGSGGVQLKGGSILLCLLD
jgi:hypothetical protein